MGFSKDVSFKPFKAIPEDVQQALEKLYDKEFEKLYELQDSVEKEVFNLYEDCSIKVEPYTGDDKHCIRIFVKHNYSPLVLMIEFLIGYTEEGNIIGEFNRINDFKYHIDLYDPKFSDLISKFLIDNV